MISVLFEVVGVVLMIFAPLSGSALLAFVILVGSPLLYLSSRAGVECGCFGKPKKLTRRFLFLSFIRNAALLTVAGTLLIEGNDYSFDRRYRFIVACVITAAFVRVLMLRRSSLSDSLTLAVSRIGNLFFGRRYVVGSKAPRWIALCFASTPGAEVVVVVEPNDVDRWRRVSERHIHSPVCVIPSPRRYLKTPVAIALTSTGVIRGIGHVSDSFELELFSRLSVSAQS